jgi:hypothetical protein
MEEEEWLRFGVAAALSRQYGADQRQFLENLAGMLERALPAEAQVVRGGLFSRKVREVRVQLGDHRYVLADPGKGLLAARRTLVKRGIALHTEELPVNAWIEALCTALQAHADQNQQACEALRRLAE